ncbi:MAG: hypothetical protein HQM04_13630 [Magnetococcales bacterium]|nr:hypothetical protein [Magnetococcales bacterium]MBF0116065.1 hypothetical protein [Magnetococcales bacterium]
MSPQIDVSAKMQDIDFIQDYYLQSRLCLESRKNSVLAALGNNKNEDALVAIGLETVRFASPDELRIFFDDLISELENLVKLDLLSVTEGHIRYDFATRINNNNQDPITSTFITLLSNSRHGAGGVSFGQILSAWVDRYPGNTDLCNKVNTYKTILDLRNWLAHGRWWNLSSGLPVHTVEDIHQISNDVLQAMGLTQHFPRQSTPMSPPTTEG